ncbi:MAG: pilus assembly protein PilM [Gallionella sp.]|nr:pilus assembly protein PilM [Gallionella sp.]
MKIPSITSFLKAKPRDAGWLAVGLTSHGVFLIQLSFDAEIPRVLRCEYHENSAISVAYLERLRRESELGNEACTTLLAAGEYQIMLMEAPNVPDNELKTAMRWKIKDSLAYSVDDAAVDVLRIPVNKNRPEHNQSLFAIATPNETIKKRMALFEQARLALSIIEIPETAQRNVARLFEQSDRALALLAFDEQGGLLTFTADGELYLSRRIEITLPQLRDANEALREQYRDRVELELQRSLDYFDRQFNHLSLSRVLLSAPDDSGLLDYLVSTVGMAVEGVDLSQVLDISAVPAMADSEFAAMVLPTLGAALRQESRA